MPMTSVEVLVLMYSEAIRLAKACAFSLSAQPIVR